MRAHAVLSDPATAGSPSLPAVKRVSLDRSTTWLERGFRDFAAHPVIGLAYGSVFALLGWLLTFGLASVGMGSLILPLAAGFMLVAPFLAVGLYEVSRRRELGQPVGPRAVLSALGRNRNMADMGLVLLLAFFAWFQLAMIIFALFFGGQPPALDAFFSQVVMAPQGPAFLITGTLVGGAVAALVFAVSVVSMPMLLGRDVSALTAMRTSLRAVWLNRMNMIGWAATLATLGVFGVLFVFAGLAVTLPVAAHASWHAYRDLVADR